MVTAFLALMLLAVPADAKRKFSFGSSSSKSSPATAPKPPGMSGLDKVFLGVVLGRSVTSASTKRLTKIFELPLSAQTKLPDGRYLHIGRLAGAIYGSSLVGYVGPTEYVKLSGDVLLKLLALAGFNSVEEFEQHIATATPKEAPTAQPDQTVALPPQEALSPMATAALAGLSAILLAVLGYFVVAWRRGRGEPPADTAPAAARRTPRVPAAALASTPVGVKRETLEPSVRRPAKLAQPVAIKVPAATNPSQPIVRRAPRDLSAMTSRLATSR